MRESLSRMKMDWKSSLGKYQMTTSRSKLLGIRRNRKRSLWSQNTSKTQWPTSMSMTRLRIYQKTMIGCPIFLGRIRAWSCCSLIQRHSGLQGRNWQKIVSELDRVKNDWNKILILLRRLFSSFSYWISESLAQNIWILCNIKTISRNPYHREGSWNCSIAR